MSMEPEDDCDMRSEPNPLFLVSGRVYTNLGELRDERVTTVVSKYVDFNALCMKIAEDSGYGHVRLGDEILVTIKVDLIEEVVD